MYRWPTFYLGFLVGETARLRGLVSLSQLLRCRETVIVAWSSCDNFKAVWTCTGWTSLNPGETHKSVAKRWCFPQTTCQYVENHPDWRTTISNRILRAWPTCCWDAENSARAIQPASWEASPKAEAPNGNETHAVWCNVCAKNSCVVQHPTMDDQWGQCRSTLTALATISWFNSLHFLMRCFLGTSQRGHSLGRFFNIPDLLWVCLKHTLTGHMFSSFPCDAAWPQPMTEISSNSCYIRSTEEIPADWMWAPPAPNCVTRLTLMGFL